MRKLPLINENGTPISYNPKYYAESVRELEEFLRTEDYMNSMAFARKVMPTFEIQSNNIIEGYKDDLLTIDYTTRNTHHSSSKEDKIKRIINLFKGYSFILENSDINKNSLKRLYDILSNGLLTPEEIKSMGKYYRTDPVYIFRSSDLTVPPLTIANQDRLEELMDRLFSFIDSSAFSHDETSRYIKSQILHLYLVYLHPYYDLNGRTARTLAM